MKKIAALIPARGGSKGVHKKNIKKLAGYPLIAYSIEACLKTGNISDVYVSTDDDEIAQISKKYGAKVPFRRPKEYSQDNSTDNQVINHFFNFFDSDFHENIAFIRPTTQLRDPRIITDCIDMFWENYERCSSVRSMHELPESPYKMYRLDDHGYCAGFLNIDNKMSYMFPFETKFSLEIDTQDQFDLLELEVLKNGNHLLG